MIFTYIVIFILSDDEIIFSYDIYFINSENIKLNGKKNELQDGKKRRHNQARI